MNVLFHLWTTMSTTLLGSNTGSPKDALLSLSSKLLWLSQLFYTLPDHFLLLDTPSPSLNPEKIADLGYASALNKSFYHTWGYKSEGLQITGYGLLLNGTLLVLQGALAYYRELAVVEAWVDALIKAALHVYSVKSEPS